MKLLFLQRHLFLSSHCYRCTWLTLNTLCQGSCCIRRLLFSKMSLSMSTWVNFKTRGSCDAHLSPYNTDHSISISCCGRKLGSCCSAHQSEQFCCTARSALCVSSPLWALGLQELPFLWLGALFEHQGQKKSELKILPAPPVRGNPKGLSSLTAVVHNKLHEFVHSWGISPAGAAMLCSNASEQACAFLARHPRSAASLLCCMCLALLCASTEEETASPAVLLAADANSLLQIQLCSHHAIYIQGGGWLLLDLYLDLLLGAGSCSGQNPGC